MEATLRHIKRATVTIFTDGESSDGDVAQALRQLERLPCWVHTLCTDEEMKIIGIMLIIIQNQQWMSDDLFGEADEVYEHNNWLTQNHCIDLENSVHIGKIRYAG